MRDPAKRVRMTSVLPLPRLGPDCRTRSASDTPAPGSTRASASRMRHNWSCPRPGGRSDRVAADADEPDRAAFALAQELRGQRSGQDHAVLLRRLRFLAGLHRRIHVEDQPQVARRLTIELVHHQLVVPGGRLPVNPAQRIAGRILPQARPPGSSPRSPCREDVERPGARPRGSSMSGSRDARG